MSKDLTVSMCSGLSKEEEDLLQRAENFMDLGPRTYGYFPLVDVTLTVTGSEAFNEGYHSMIFTYKFDEDQPDTFELHFILYDDGTLALDVDLEEKEPTTELVLSLILNQMLELYYGLVGRIMFSTGIERGSDNG